jgi:hypothetical protein
MWTQSAKPIGDVEPVHERSACFYRLVHLCCSLTRPASNVVFKINVYMLVGCTSPIEMSCHAYTQHVVLNVKRTCVAGWTRCMCVCMCFCDFDCWDGNCLLSTQRIRFILTPPTDRHTSQRLLECWSNYTTDQSPVDRVSPTQLDTSSLGACACARVRKPE